MLYTYIGVCPKPNNPINGNVVFSDLLEGNYAKYTCDSGYDLLGSPTIVCLSTGFWNPASPTYYSKEQTIYLCYIFTYVMSLIIL